MTELAYAAAAICVIGYLLHLCTCGLVIYRCWRKHAPVPAEAAAGEAPPVSLICPVRGVDQFDEETLRSSFCLNYPRYELLFCCADASDPAAALVRRLMAEYPHVRARLLIGDQRCCENPKLNNILKGWDAAVHDWIVISDCNVMMPRDYIQQLRAAWLPDTGLVCSPPIGCRPQGYWAEVECAFLNTYQARWQLAADALGYGFAQGKSMLWRRTFLDASGGLEALGREIAEDAAATKLVRSHRLNVRLVDRPFGQPLGRRSAVTLWARQVRWARLRRATFPLHFIPEILTTGLLPIGCLVFAASALEVLDPATAAAIAITIWYGSEAMIAGIAGWHVSLYSPLAWLSRDLLIPAVWIAAWMSRSFTWRGNDMTTQRRRSHVPQSLSV